MKVATKKQFSDDTRKHFEYEAAKRDWCRLNPHASPLEYQRAMTLIAKRLWI